MTRVSRKRRRRLTPLARRVGQLVNDSASVNRRLNNLIDQLIAVEMDSSELKRHLRDHHGAT